MTIINRIKLKKGYAVFIGLLIILSTLNATAIKINIIGWASIFALLLLAILFNMEYLRRNRTFPIAISKILILLFIFNLIYFVGIVNDNFRLRGFIVYLQLTALMIFFIMMALMQWEDREIKIISRFVEIFIVLNFLVLVGMNFPYPFKSFLRNSNVFSALIFFMSFFLVMNYLTTVKNRKRLYLSFVIAITLLLIIMGQSRAIWGTALLSFIVFWKWGFITKSKLRYYLFFIGVLIANIGFVIVLPILRQHPNAVLWNRFVFEKTGGNLFSGREFIWKLLLSKILDKPVMGYGASVTPDDLIAVSLSSHNLYIQTSIQVGLVGTCVLFLLLLGIWALMYNGKNNIYTRLSGAYFIGIITYQSAEVSLTQNNMAVGIIMWLVIAIGISHSIISEQISKNIPRC